MTPAAQKTANRYVDFLSTLNDDIKLSIISSLSASLVKNKTNTSSSKNKRSFGMLKGKLQYPDDIDFCNDEIAEMFGVN